MHSTKCVKAPTYVLLRATQKYALREIFESTVILYIEKEFKRLGAKQESNNVKNVL